jgi:hypothetical protein
MKYKKNTRNLPLKLFKSSFSALARLEVGREPASALRLRDSMESLGREGWPLARRCSVTSTDWGPQMTQQITGAIMINRPAHCPQAVSHINHIDSSEAANVEHNLWLWLEEWIRLYLRSCWSGISKPSVAPSPPPPPPAHLQGILRPSNRCRVQTSSWYVCASHTYRTGTVWARG